MSEDQGTWVSVVGSIVKADPTLEFSPQGHAISKFSVRIPGRKAKGSTPATEASFKDVVVWRQLAENVAESLGQGDRVIVQGYEKTRSWEYEGKPYSATEINAWNVGIDLSYATAQISRTERTEAPQPAAVGAGNVGRYDEPPF